MTHGTRFGIVVVATLVMSSCDGPSEPSRSVEGSWGGCCVNGIERYELSLTQRGDVIEGVACMRAHFAMWADRLPVSGSYPNVRFVLEGPVIVVGVPSARLVPRPFSGTLEPRRDQIAGTLGETPLRFNRIYGDGRCLPPVSGTGAQTD